MVLHLPTSQERSKRPEAHTMLIDTDLATIDRTAGRRGDRHLSRRSATLLTAYPRRPCSGHGLN